MIRFSKKKSKQFLFQKTQLKFVELVEFIAEYDYSSVRKNYKLKDFIKLLLRQLIKLKKNYLHHPIYMNI